MLGDTPIIKKEVREQEKKREYVDGCVEEYEGCKQSEEDTRYDRNNQLRKIKNNLFLLKKTV